MRRNSILWPVLLGCLAGALANCPLLYSNVDLLVFDQWLKLSSFSFPAAVIASFISKRNHTKVALWISVGIMTSFLIRIIFDVTILDPTSHNLAPIELIIVAFQSFPPAWLGSFFVRLFYR